MQISGEKIEIISFILDICRLKIRFMIERDTEIYLINTGTISKSECKHFEI